MGVFTLIPRAGAKYSAEVTGPDGTVRRFDLPAASDSAAVLSVDNRTSGLHVTAAGRVPASARLLILNRARLAGFYGIGSDRLIMIDKEELPRV